MSVPILIRLGVKSKLRDNAERYRETKTYSETWVIHTNSDTYSSDINTAFSPIWAYTLSERSKLAEVGLHYSVTLDNVTAPTPAAGSWVQAKGHFDGELTTTEFTDVLAKTKLNEAIKLIVTHAKY